MGKKNKLNLVILKNETSLDHLEWIESIEKNKELLNYRVVDITLYNWFEMIYEEPFDLLIARPPGQIEHFKTLYEERLYYLTQVLKEPVYPSFNEVLIYENKRNLSYWLKAYDIPHPKTFIFYHKQEAYIFADNCNYPIVGKTSIGAGGSGVKIFNNNNQLKKYIESAFSNQGISRNWGPNFRKGNISKRVMNRLKNIPETIKYFENKRKSSIGFPQKNFIILQEYIKSDFEWRCVRIGDSFFGHKKLSGKGELKSGTSLVKWDTPSDELLDFIKDITDKGKLYSVAIDVFKSSHKGYLVNEIQCYFGSKNPHQMIVNGTPGRFINNGNKWIFEKGVYNSNNSFDLRVDHILSLYKN